MVLNQSDIQTRQRRVLSGLIVDRRWFVMFDDAQCEPDRPVPAHLIYKIDFYWICFLEDRNLTKTVLFLSILGRYELD